MTNEAENTWGAEHRIETTANPEAIWALFRDVDGWKKWNVGVERSKLEGPFANGTWFTMKPPEGARGARRGTTGVKSRAGVKQR